MGASSPLPMAGFAAPSARDHPWHDSRDLEWLVGSGAPLVQKIRCNSLYWGAGLLPQPFPWTLGAALTHTETLSKGT